MLAIGSAVQLAAGGDALHTVSGRLCSSRASCSPPSIAHSTSCGQPKCFSRAGQPGHGQDLLVVQHGRTAVRAPPPSR